MSARLIWRLGLYTHYTLFSNLNIWGIFFTCQMKGCTRYRGSSPFSGLWCKQYKKKSYNQDLLRTSRVWVIAIFVWCFNYLQSTLVLVISFAPTELCELKRTNNLTSGLHREGNWGLRIWSEALQLLHSWSALGPTGSNPFSCPAGGFACRTVYVDSFSSPDQFKCDDLGSWVVPSLIWPSPQWHFIPTHVS